MIDDFDQADHDDVELDRAYDHDLQRADWDDLHGNERVTRGSDRITELEQRVANLERRFAGLLETNDLWDGTDG